MAERGDEIEAAVNSVVNDVSAIKTALVMEVALELVVNVADNGAETGGQKYTSFQPNSGLVPELIQATIRRSQDWEWLPETTTHLLSSISYQSWLLMASPYPGVSTTVRRSFTPRSSISTVDASIWTVRSIFSVRRKTSTLNVRVQPTADNHFTVLLPQVHFVCFTCCSRDDSLRVKVSEEKAVDQGGFSKSGFTFWQQAEMKQSTCHQCW